MDRRIKVRCCIAPFDIYEIGERVSSSSYPKGYYIDQRRPANKDDKILIPKGALHYNVSSIITRQDQYLLKPPRYSDILTLVNKTKADLYKIAEEMEDYIIDLSNENKITDLSNQIIKWKKSITILSSQCSHVTKKKVLYWLDEVTKVEQNLITEFKVIDNSKHCEIIQDMLFDLSKEFLL